MPYIVVMLEWSDASAQAIVGKMKRRKETAVAAVPVADQTVLVFRPAKTDPLIGVIGVQN